MMQMTTKRTLLLGLAILVLSNAIALGGVAYNRSGEPTTILTLTERELTLPYSYGFAKENSGISLKLRWRVFDSKKTKNYYSGWSQAEWLDADKLGLLGFDVSYPVDNPDSHQYYQKALSREVFLVFEYDGEAYQRVLQQRTEALETAQKLYKQNPDKDEFEKRLNKAKADFKAEQQGYSRLFAVDGGLDYETLRQQYSNKRQYLIVKGTILLRYVGRYNKSPYLTGIIKQLSVQKVNMPLAYSADLLSLLETSNRRKRGRQPRYEVSVKYGQRYEPWVTSVTVLGKQ